MAKKSKSKTSSNKIVFRSGARIGFAAAEDDTEFLESCYIDVGHVQQALDTDDPGSIILGRTGCGKTAALLHILNTEKHVVSVDPEDLSLNYISNSNLLSFFHGIGVNLDLFFQLLWRHVLCVELINYHYKVQNRMDFESVSQKMKDLLVGNDAKRLALEYLEVWGSRFWEETQQRIREIVQKFEDDLRAGVDLSVVGVPINAQGSKRIQGDQRIELINKASKVVNRVQIKSLSILMDVMAEDIFNDESKKYFLIVDRLDENWIDDSLRYKLIRGLIETIKAFRKIRNVKLIIALRSDLVERVYKYTMSAGFQEEKYEDFNVPVKWLRDDLFKIVDLRINELFKRKYTKENVHFYDIFPERYRQQGDSFDYLVQRTLLRPRDIIAFVNLIFVEVAGKQKITSNDIDKAEGEYSKKRLQALYTEWQEEHPCLDLLVEPLRRMPTRIIIDELSQEILERTILSLWDFGESPDNMCHYALEFMEDRFGFDGLRSHMVIILYKVGVLGIKPSQNEPVHFSYSSSFVPELEDLKSEVRLSVAPMLWRALGNVRVKRKGDIVGP